MVFWVVGIQNNSEDLVSIKARSLDKIKVKQERENYHEVIT